MKKLKHVFSLVLVLGALVVASFGGGFEFTGSWSETTPSSELTPESSEIVLKNDDLAGIRGLHW